MPHPCIIRQSTMLNGSAYQQLSNLTLTGISSRTDAENTDRGRLYGSLTQASGVYTLNVWKDETKLDLVASGTSTTTGTMTLAQQNASGLSGTVNLAQYTADDNLIQVRCLFAVDDDIPMDNLTGLADFDPINGFSLFHIRVFNKIVEVVTSRYRSILWNPSLIDANSINGGIGGWDLSRCNNLEALRDPARYYAFMLLCERQTVEPGSVFDMRAKEARSMFKAHMESIELTFDISQQRVDEKSRSLSTFKVGRC